tara:strand:+ start:808 stop:1434 length:627 start_codon:yes stop_codon:yes gene_type:complete
VDKQRQKYKGLLDMIDGGGANAVGNEFQGGGLLSVIANAIATPYGSSDRMRDDMQAQRPMARPAGGFGNGSINSVASSLRPQSRPEIGPNLNPFGGAGPNITGVAAERGMGLDPFGGAGNFTPPQSQVDQEMAMGLGPFGYGGRPIYENVPETSGMNPSNAYLDPKQRFAKELVEMIGPDEAENYFGTGAGEMLYDNYVKNGYKFLNY